MPDIRELLKPIPCWVIALTLSTGVAAIYNHSSNDWYYAALLALFLPGALKRLNWRHILIALGCALGIMGIQAILDQFANSPKWLNVIINTALPPAVMVAMETRIVLKKWSKLLKPMLMGVAVILFVNLSREVSWLMELDVTILGHRNLDDLLFIILTPTISWLLVPLGIKSAQKNSPKFTPFHAWTTTGISVILITRFILVPFSASISMNGHGPFSKNRSVLYRFDHLDSNDLWRLLESDPWRPYHQHWIADWRRYAISTMMKQKSDATAKRLRDMLMAKPNPVLADIAAPHLIKSGLHETIPTLTRYALLGKMRDESFNQLVDVGYPQAAMAIIAKYIISQPYASMAHLSSKDGDKLVELLGYDKGAYGWDWYHAFTETYPTNRPTALSETDAEQVDATLYAWIDYTSMNLHFRTQIYFAFCNQLLEHGRTNELHVLCEFSRMVYPHSYVSEMSREKRARFNKEFLPLSEELILFKNRLKPTPPDWNVPSATDLEKEICAYDGRGREIISTLNTNQAPLERFLQERFPELAEESDAP